MQAECRRRLSIRDTVFEAVHLVTPTHTNPLGTLHGGVMLRWIITTATMASMRATRGYTVLAHLDNVFFINPVRQGENVTLTAWIDYAGTTSLDLTVYVESEDPSTGDRRLTTASHMTMVHVNNELKPEPHGLCITPADDYEEELYREALIRRRERPSRGERAAAARDVTPPKPLIDDISMTTAKLVNPEDTIAYNVMHAGRLMYLMDELAGMTAMRYSKRVVVTAAVDATDFYSPIWVGDILEINAALTYVGRTSMEITLKAIAETPLTGERRHAATSHFTMVALGSDGRPVEVPKPRKPASREELARAEARRRLRMKRLTFVKERITAFKPPKP